MDVLLLNPLSVCILGLNVVLMALEWEKTWFFEGSLQQSEASTFLSKITCFGVHKNQVVIPAIL